MADLTGKINVFGKISEKIFPQIREKEAAIKNSIVMPFIQMLGYDVFDPFEVTPEFIADESNKRQKVDFAITVKDYIILVQYALPKDMESRTYFIRSCFSMSYAAFAIMTDGMNYRFYADDENINTMDNLPFMEFNIREMKEVDIVMLNKFQKSSFDKVLISSFIEEYKYTLAIKKLISNELKNPSPEFVRFIAGQVYKEPNLNQLMPMFTDIVRKNFRLPPKKEIDKGDINKKSFEKDSLIKKYKFEPATKSQDVLFGQNMENPYNSYGFSDRNNRMQIKISKKK